MENPNEYNDDLFTEAVNELTGAVASMWEAGASPENIADAVKDALLGERANEGGDIAVTIAAA